MAVETKHVIPFRELDNDDVAIVGGKNASLGEMIRELAEEGIRVPDGFATTADAYRKFVKENDLETVIRENMDSYQRGDCTLQEAGTKIRSAFVAGEFSTPFSESILEAYHNLSATMDVSTASVAVRSSATAEDLPTASFAGQQETYLNIRGEDNLLEACRKCFASLFTDRAISYRNEQEFDHLEVALSVGVQAMVRSDKACAGVMFTIDTESGFPDVVVINGAWGLGETVVQGTVSPDEYEVFKPLLEQESTEPIIEKNRGGKEVKIVYGKEDRDTLEVGTTEQEQNQFVLTDEEILTLARWACRIEQHYDKPMDIEWAKDGESGELFIVQARPETVQSQDKRSHLRTYTLKEQPEPLLEGLSIGDMVASGEVCLVEGADDIEDVRPGSILVTKMTQPDWVPIMKKARGIVTEDGGRTCHAAIVSRELGIPAVVGTGNATEVLSEGRVVTISCAEGETGFVYAGELDVETTEINLSQLPDTETKIMLNMASPAGAFRWWSLPVDGIGLARMEFIINNEIKIHPMALVEPDRVEDPEARETIERMTRGYKDRTDYFVERLSLGIGKLAASQYPEPVIVRMSDFKTNEYADLIGGESFEPEEGNPMLGFRGASRYYSPEYREGFGLECRAIKQVREQIGMDNVVVMIPFCRTLEEADRVLQVMEEEGLKQGEQELEIYVMAEIPSNVFLADRFADRFDGFSIGSNDLTQLVLGVDRDSTRLSEIFDERNDAVKKAISDLIRQTRESGVPVGICGQAPSDYPDFAEFLVREGIDSLSLSPDSVVEVLRRVAEVESS